MKRGTTCQRLLAGALGALLGVLLGRGVQASVDLPTVIKGIDVVGVPAAQAAELLRVLGLKEGMQVPYSRLGEAVVKPAEAKLEGMGRFREVAVRPTTFIGGQDDGATYLTISVVDRVASVAPRPTPSRRLSLPQAVSVFFAERVRGMGAFRDTLLPIDQDRLEALAEEHAEALLVALADAADPMVRAQAAQAIAFLPDSVQARTVLQDALLDPDARVRRDVARALLPLLDRQVGRMSIPLEPYVKLIRMPEPADRMNAATFFLRLGRVPDARSAIVQEAGDALLVMARMKHPGERTLALETLQVLSDSPEPRPWDAYKAWWENTTARRFVD